MANSLSSYFDQVAKIAGICPCCGHVFRLGDARPFKRTPRQPTVLDQIESQQARIDAALEKLEQAEQELRESARLGGLTAAKRKLRLIDRVFSAAKLDPHDVKVLFDPVEYIVFDGMSRGKLKRVLLLAEEPISTECRKSQDAVAKAVGARNFLFRTLRISKDGDCVMR